MSHAYYVAHQIRRKVGTHAVDALIAALAAAQYGVVARFQLRAMGIGEGAIERRIAMRRLHRIHRGVYAVGHTALSRHASWMAAVLVAETAVLGCRSAGAVWSLRPYQGRIEVVTARQIRAPRGVRPRCFRLEDDEVTVRGGIPVTTVARTLFDLAAVLQQHQLERAIEQAELQQRFDLTALVDLLNRHPRRRGTRNLRQALTNAAMPTGITRSDLEALWRTALLAESLPPAILNPTLELDGTAYEPDSLWPDQKVVVELDSRGFHDTATAFEEDRRRDRIFAAAGYVVVRVTWRQLTRERRRVFDDIAALLGARGRRAAA